MKASRFLSLVRNEVGRTVRKNPSFMLILVIIVFLAMFVNSIASKDASIETATLPAVLLVTGLAVFSVILFVCPAFSSDLEDRSFVFIVSKPIRRTAYFFSKVLAVLLVQFAVLAVFSAILTVVIFAVFGAFPVNLAVAVAAIVSLTFFLDSAAFLFSSVSNRNIVSIILFFIAAFIVVMVGEVSEKYSAVELLIGWMAGILSPLNELTAMSLEPVILFLISGLALIFMSATVYSRREP